VAEGVEDEATLQILRTIGVDYVQGFGIAMPFELQLENSPMADAAA
jgi:EAL domain-containing protein (putative c-di-GMP-specific phosphodiesterase class I)